jgi:hypothetical protein
MFGFYCVMLLCSKYFAKFISGVYPFFLVHFYVINLVTLEKHPKGFLVDEFCELITFVNEISLSLSLSPVLTFH